MDGLSPDVVKPGLVLFLPSVAMIPATSVVHRQFKASQSYYAHPVLVIELEPSRGLAIFVPIVSLRGRRLEEEQANHWVWPRFLAIEERWNVAEEMEPEDHKGFEKVFLGRMSLRTSQTLWVSVNKAYQVEYNHLMRYPPTKPAHRLCLPNPPVYFDNSVLQHIVALHKKFKAHSRCAEGPRNVKAAGSIREGLVARLPAAPLPTSALLRQISNDYERPFGHPFLVTKIHGNSIAGYPLTSFGSEPITYRYAQSDPLTMWIRARYLPIEGSFVHTHGNLPVVRLSEGSRQMREATYVHVAKEFWLDASELLHWSKPGLEHQEVHITPESLKVIEEYADKIRKVKKPSGSEKSSPALSTGHWGNPGQGNSAQPTGPSAGVASAPRLPGRISPSGLNPHAPVFIPRGGMGTGGFASNTPSRVPDLVRSISQVTLTPGDVSGEKNSPKTPSYDVKLGNWSDVIPAEWSLKCYELKQQH